MTRDGTLMRRILVGIAAAATASSLPLAWPTAALSEPPAATSAAPATADAETSGGWVTGVVVDGNGDPVAGDLVNALGPKEVPEAGIIGHTDRRTWTDKNGAFRVRQPDRHGYLVQVCNPEPSNRRACKETAQGVDHIITYVGPDGTTDGWVLQTRLFPSTQTDRDLGTVTVKPPSFVHGRIRGAANQQIRIVRRNGSVAYYNETDGRGAFRFQGLAPGPYRVEAGGDGSGWLAWRSDTFQLGVAEDRQVDGALDPGAEIHGVLRSNGGPVPFTDVLVRKLHGALVAAVTTDAQGRYRVTGLLPGTYRVGILYDGSDYQRHGVVVAVPEAHASVAQRIVVGKGATITVGLRAGGQPATRAVDELRDRSGMPVLGLRNDGTGHVSYPGLSPGFYTVVAASKTRYVTATVRVRTARAYDLGTRSLDTPTLTLTGRTAPHAVVEAKTGQECPPDKPREFGVFQFVERADAAGRYTLHGLVPGLYMLGSDGWPRNYAARCIPDVTISQDQSRDLPLTVGSTASGRLVYASTGTPVITTLSYELSHPRGLPTNPTGEHPTRAKTRNASGDFTIDRLPAGRATGALSQGADLEQINSPRFLVIFPFQDGTPYYLTSKRRAVDVGRHEDLKLGDIPIYLHG